MLHRLTRVAILLSVVALLLGGCAMPAAPATAPARASADAKPLKVLLFVNGTLGDKSFFDSALRGIERAAAACSTRGRRSK